MGIAILAGTVYSLITHQDHFGWVHYVSILFLVAGGVALLPSKKLFFMSFEGIQQYVTTAFQKKCTQRHVTRIDLRTMRPSEKQKVVDDVRREYVSEQITWFWEPADATEIWIKESHGGELFQEFVARLLQKQALVLQRQDEPEPTVAHPLIQALADVNTEARRVVWRLGNDVAYENTPDDSGGEIDKA